MSTITQRVKPFHCFFPITRVDEEKREVTAYAFVNEVVDGEGGLRLKRSAMEAATPDYMEWANIREMHQPNAAGVASSVVWDQQGAQMTLRVVDDAAWEKCRTGVYKGLSVGVRPLLLRGKEVEKCLWFETSLVDRPKDPGARFIAVRAEGADPDAESDVEVEVEDADPIERAADPASFTDLVSSHEPDTLRSLAFDLLRYALVRIQRSNLADKDAKIRESIQQFADYITPIIAGPPAQAEDPCDCYYAAMPTVTRLLATDGLADDLREALTEIQRGLTVEPEAVPDLTRVQTLETERDELLQRAETLSTENGTLLERAETAENELATVQRTLTAAEERVRTLEAEPAPLRAPVRFPQALTREFAANQQQTAGAEITALQAELQRLETELPAEPDAAKKREGVIRFNTIRQELAVLGVRG